MTAPPQQLLQLARRASTIGITSLTGWTSYKANTDPLHIFWDLDHTILCSVTPLPSAASSENRNDINCGEEESSSLIKPPTIHHFDQIDDDFPYTPLTVANTRTYFRPGAKVALWLCSKLGICHVYTAAQESYTMNILNELDPLREVFRGVVLHRTEYPRIVRDGKDLTVVMGGGTSNDDDGGCANNDNDDGANDIRLERAILFDDKVSNFKPQKYENGVSVLPFSEERLNKCLSSTNNNKNSSSSSSNENYHNVMDNWTAYLEEVKEMARLVGISVWGTVHLSGDVRKVVDWVRKLNGGDNEV